LLGQAAWAKADEAKRISAPASATTDFLNMMRFFSLGRGA